MDRSELAARLGVSDGCRVGWRAIQRLTLLTASLLLVSSCSGGSDDTTHRGPNPASSTSPRTETQTTEPSIESPADASSNAAEVELEEAYSTYIAAFLTGDAATAYALLSERCRNATPLSEFAGASEAAADLYGEVEFEINRVEVNAGKGLVDATFAVEALNSDEGGTPWLLEDGDWHSDHCG